MPYYYAKDKDNQPVRFNIHGTTPNAVEMERINKILGIQPPPDPANEMNPLMAGARGGLADITTAAAKSAQMMGATETAGDLLDYASGIRQYVDENYKPGVAKWGDVNGIGDFASYLYNMGGQSIGYMAAPLAGAAVGTLLAPQAAPAGIAAGLGFAAADLPQYFGGNIQRQMEENKVGLADTHAGSALAAAGFQTAFDVVTPATFGVFKRIAGLAGNAATDVVAPVVGEAAKKTWAAFAGRLSKKTAEAMITEAGTETLQQALEIYQANPDKIYNLPPETIEELGEAFAGGLILGGAFGLVGANPKTEEDKMKELQSRLAPEMSKQAQALSAAKDANIKLAALKQWMKPESILKARERATDLETQAEEWKSALQGDKSGSPSGPSPAPGGAPNAPRSAPNQSSSTPASSPEMDGGLPRGTAGASPYLSPDPDTISPPSGPEPEQSSNSTAAPAAAPTETAQPDTKKSSALPGTDQTSEAARNGLGERDKGVDLSVPAMEAPDVAGVTFEDAGPDARPDAVKKDGLNAGNDRVETRGPYIALAIALNEYAAKSLRENAAKAEAAVNGTGNQKMVALLKSAEEKRAAAASAVVDMLKRFGINRAVHQFADSLNNYKSNEFVEGSYDDVTKKGKPFQGLIQLSHDAWDPNSSLEDYVNGMVGVAAHEILHHLRAAGSIREGEWKALVRQAGRMQAQTRVGPSKGTYIERASVLYHDPNLTKERRESKIDEIEEEAVAEMLRNYVLNKAKIPEHPKTLFKRVLAHLRALFAFHNARANRIMDMIVEGRRGDKRVSDPSLPKHGPSVGEPVTGPNQHIEPDNVFTGGTGRRSLIPIGMTPDEFIEKALDERVKQDMAKAQPPAEKRTYRVMTRPANPPQYPDPAFYVYYNPVDENGVELEGFNSKKSNVVKQLFSKTERGKSGEAPRTGYNNNVWRKFNTFEEAQAHADKLTKEYKPKPITPNVMRANIKASKSWKVFEAIVRSEFVESSKTKFSKIPASPTSEAVKVEPDMVRLKELLGQKMYSADLPTVTVKELIQNSWDGIKAAYKSGKLQPRHGHIMYKVDQEHRRISVADNGSGMTPEIVKNAFLKIAGSEKGDLSPGERSGGFGLAKLAFLLGSERFRLFTVRDGVATYFDTTGEEINNGKVEVKTKPMPGSPNGTFVDVQLPEIGTNVDGDEIQLQFRDPRYGDIDDSPLVGDVDLLEMQQDWDGVTERLPGFEQEQLIIRGISGIGPRPELRTVGYDEDKLPPHPIMDQRRIFRRVWTPGLQYHECKFNTTAQTRWGNVDIYISPEKVSGANVVVLSSGVFQFSVKLDRAPGSYERLPYNVVLDVKPSVGATERLYPFTREREGFARVTEKDVSAIYQYLQLIGRSREANEVSLMYSDPQFIDSGKLVDPGVFAELEAKILTALQKQGSGTSIKDVISVTEGVVTDARGKLMFEAGKVDFGVDVKALQEKVKIESNILDPFYNKTAIFSSLETDIIDGALEWEGAEGLERDKRRIQMVNFLDSFGFMMRNVRDLFVETFNNEPGQARRNEDRLEKIEKTALGVLLEKPEGAILYGVNFRVPYNGIGLNIFEQRAVRDFRQDGDLNALKARIPGMVESMVATIIHEFAHERVRDHYDSFTEEYHLIRDVLYDRKYNEMRSLEEWIRREMENSIDVFQSLAVSYEKAKQRPGRARTIGGSPQSAPAGGDVAGPDSAGQTGRGPEYTGQQPGSMEGARRSISIVGPDGIRNVSRTDSPSRTSGQTASANLTRKFSRILNPDNPTPVVSPGQMAINEMSMTGAQWKALLSDKAVNFFDMYGIKKEEWVKAGVYDMLDKGDKTIFSTADIYEHLRKNSPTIHAYQLTDGDASDFYYATIGARPENMAMYLVTLPEDITFRGKTDEAHFGNFYGGNVLGHVTLSFVNAVIDKKIRRVAIIEEIQSDFWQRFEAEEKALARREEVFDRAAFSLKLDQLRKDLKEVVQNDPTMKELTERFNSLPKKTPEKAQANLARSQRKAELQAPIREEIARLEFLSGVSADPAARDWRGILFNTAVQAALDRGAEFIAFVPGEVIAKRWTIENRFQKVKIDPFTMNGELDPKKIRISSTWKPRLKAFDERPRPDDDGSGNMRERQMSLKELQVIFGREFTNTIKRILSNPRYNMESIVLDFGNTGNSSKIQLGDEVIDILQVARDSDAKKMESMRTAYGPTGKTFKTANASIKRAGSKFVRKHIDIKDYVGVNNVGRNVPAVAKALRQQINDSGDLMIADITPPSVRKRHAGGISRYSKIPGIPLEFRSAVVDELKADRTSITTGRQWINLLNSWVQKRRIKKEELDDTGTLEWLERSKDIQIPKEDLLYWVESRQPQLTLRVGMNDDVSQFDEALEDGEYDPGIYVNVDGHEDSGDEWVQVSNPLEIVQRLTDEWGPIDHLLDMAPKAVGKPKSRMTDMDYFDYIYPKIRESYKRILATATPGTRELAGYPSLPTGPRKVAQDYAEYTIEKKPKGYRATLLEGAQAIATPQAHFNVRHNTQAFGRHHISNIRLPGDAAPVRTGVAEEVQSDLHQKARKAGYRTAEDELRIARKIREIKELEAKLPKASLEIDVGDYKFYLASVLYKDDPEWGMPALKKIHDSFPNSADPDQRDAAKTLIADMIGQPGLTLDEIEAHLRTPDTSAPFSAFDRYTQHNSIADKVEAMHMVEALREATADPEKQKIVQASEEVWRLRRDLMSDPAMDKMPMVTNRKTWYRQILLAQIVQAWEQGAKRFAIMGGDVVADRFAQRSYLYKAELRPMSKERGLNAKYSLKVGMGDSTVEPIVGTLRELLEKLDPETVARVKKLASTKGVQPFVVKLKEPVVTTQKAYEGTKLYYDNRYVKEAADIFGSEPKVSDFNLGKKNQPYSSPTNQPYTAAFWDLNEEVMQRVKTKSNTRWSAIPHWYKINEYRSQFKDVMEKEKVGKQTAAQWLHLFNSWIQKGKVKREELEDTGVWEFLTEISETRPAEKMSKEDVLSSYFDPTTYIDFSRTEDTGRDDVSENPEAVSNAEEWVNDNLDEDRVQRELERWWDDQGDYPADEEDLKELFPDTWEEEYEKARTEYEDRREKYFDDMRSEAEQYIRRLMIDEVLQDYSSYFPDVSDMESHPYEEYTITGNSGDYKIMLLKGDETIDTSSSHMNESRKVQGFVRFKIRNVVTPDGRLYKTLYIEEIQSDIHQQARKKGYLSKRVLQNALPMRMLRDKIDEFQYLTLRRRGGMEDDEWYRLPASERIPLYNLYSNIKDTGGDLWRQIQFADAVMKFLTGPNIHQNKMKFEGEDYTESFWTMTPKELEGLKNRIIAAIKKVEITDAAIDQMDFLFDVDDSPLYEDYRKFTDEIYRETERVHKDIERRERRNEITYRQASGERETRRREDEHKIRQYKFDKLDELGKEGLKEIYRKYQIDQIERDYMDTIGRRGLAIQRFEHAMEKLAAENPIPRPPGASYMEWYQATEQEFGRLEAKLDEIDQAVPDLPYKKSWYRHLMQAALKYGIQQGVEAVAIVPSETVGVRYSTQGEHSNWLIAPAKSGKEGRYDLYPVGARMAGIANMNDGQGTRRDMIKAMKQYGLYTDKQLEAAGLSRFGTSDSPDDLVRANLNLLPLIPLVKDFDPLDKRNYPSGVNFAAVHTDFMVAAQLLKDGDANFTEGDMRMKAATSLPVKVLRDIRRQRGYDKFYAKDYVDTLKELTGITPVKTPLMLPTSRNGRKLYEENDSPINKVPDHALVVLTPTSKEEILGVKNTRWSKFSINPVTVQHVQNQIVYSAAANMVKRALGKLGFRKATINSTQDMVDNVIQHMADKMLPLGQIIDQLRASGTEVPQEWDAYLKFELMRGKTGDALRAAEQDIYAPLLDAIRTLPFTDADIDSLKRIAPNFAEFAEEAESTNMGMLQAYAVAMHVPERNAVGMVRDPSNPAASGFDTNEALLAQRWFKSHAEYQVLESARGKLLDVVRSTNEVRVAHDLAPDFNTLNPGEDFAAAGYPRGFENYVPIRGRVEEDPDLDPNNPLDRKASETIRVGRGVNVRGREDWNFLGRGSTKMPDGSVRLNRPPPLVIEHTILQNMQAIIRGKKNKTAQSVYTLIKEFADKAIEYRGKNRFIHSIAEVVADTPIQKRLINGVVKYVEDRFFKNDPDMLTCKIKEQDENGNYTGRIREISIHIKDDRLRRALTGANGYGEEAISKIMSMIATYTQTIAKLSTQWNPLFLLTNFPRDLGAAMVNLQEYEIEGLSKRVLQGVPSSMRAIWRSQGTRSLGYVITGTEAATSRYVDAQGTDWTDLLERFRRNGGDLSFYGLEDIYQLHRRINEKLHPDSAYVGQARAAFQRLGDFVEAYNKTVESSIRLATFRAMLEAGMNDEMAARAAKSVTVNFDKGGIWKSNMTALYMFYNASMQGTMTLFSAAARSRSVRKVIGGLFFAGLMQDLIMSTLAGDDDETGENKYDMIPDHVLEHKMIWWDPIGMSPNGFLSIPMPYGYNVPHNMGRTISRLMRGRYDYGQAFNSSAGAMVDAFNPMGGTSSILAFAAPTLLDPVAEISLNQDWSGKPIYKPENPYDANPPLSQRHWNNTGWLSKGITDTLHWVSGGTPMTPGAFEFSPDVLDYLFKYYMGGLGAAISQTQGFVTSTVPRMLTGDEIEVREIPVLSKFSGNITSRATTEKFFEVMDTAARAEKEYKNALKSGDVDAIRAALRNNKNLLPFSNQARALASMRSALSKRIRQISNNTRIPESRREELVKPLRERMKQIEARMVKQYNERVRDAE